MPSRVIGDSSVSATALHANLLDRFFRVAKANANNVLKNFEDPQKVMEQAVEDMQRDLIRVRQTYAEVTATQRRMANSKRHLESQANDWYNRAQLALKNSNEGLAREALARREALLSQASSIQTQTAKSTQKINDMLSGLTGKTSMDAFNRMEDKVLALEAAAEVSTEMAQNTISAALLPSSKTDTENASDIEIKFRMLEASNSVDKELEKLKANILPGQSSFDKSVSAFR